MNANLLSFVCGLSVNLVLIPLAIGLCHKYGFLDRPGHRKIHDTPIPKLGGVSFLLSVLVALGAYFIMFSGSSWDNSKLFSVMAVAIGFALLGFLDDLYDLKPSLKLFWQLIVTGIFVSFGFRFEAFHIPGFTPVALTYLSLPITALWMMAVVNGFNFMDGVDGLTGSVTAVCLVGLGLVSMFIGEPALQALAFASLGAILAFLFFNWRPAKIYLGNCGTNLLGGLVAAFLVSYHKEPTFFTNNAHSAQLQPFPFQLVLSTLLVGYPFLEATLSTLRRGVKRFLFNRSMEWSEKEHIHHLLLKKGFTAPAISLTGLLLQTAFSASALLVLAEQRALAVWILVPVSMALAYVGPRMGFLEFFDFRSIRTQQPHYQIAHHFIQMQRIKLGLARTRDEIVALMNQSCAELGVQGFKINVKANGHGNSPCQFTWERTHEIQREYLSYIKTELNLGHFDQFKDKLSLDSGTGQAMWMFEPHTDEAELDVEYRVLVNDFMKEALTRLCYLKGDKSVEPRIELTGLAHAKVRSALLRRKHTKKDTNVKVLSKT